MSEEIKVVEQELSELLQVRRDKLKALQDAGEFTAQLVLQEEYKNYPVEDVWAEFCRRAGVPADEAWFKQVRKYEKDVLLKRV